MPRKYALPAGSARIKLLIALAARYTGDAARGWDEWAGLDTHLASQNSGRFGYSFGKTRTYMPFNKGCEVIKKLSPFSLMTLTCVCLKISPSEIDEFANRFADCIVNRTLS